MDYKPIEDYGIIGDLHTVALVGTDGSIDEPMCAFIAEVSVQRARFAAVLRGYARGITIG